MKISAEKLTEQVYDILVAAGVSADQAKTVAASLVESNLLGHDSHGVIRVPSYVKAIREGEINLKADMKVTQEHPGSVVIDADWGFGQIAGQLVMDKVVEKAKQQAVACGSIFNCNDLARLGEYTVRATKHNCIAMLMVNDGGANPCVAPWGGKEPILSTNPISMAVPLGDAPAICMDMATSVIAGGKVKVARQRGENLPPGCIINSAGQMSIDPNDFFADPPGALLAMGAPLAGHKGFALSLMVDILSGALSGSGCSGTGEMDSLGQGVFALAINIEAFCSLEDFFGQVGQLAEKIKSSSKAKGVKEILLPGQRGWQQKAIRIKEGIFIEEATCKALAQTAQELGVKGQWQ